MSLTESNKANIRRHLGYPAYGVSSNQNTGYRYWTHYGRLEFRMNNLSIEEEDLLVNKFLVDCDRLEAALYASSDNLDTDKAAVWTHNKNEINDRNKLYKLACNRMAKFMDVPNLDQNKLSLVV